MIFVRARIIHIRRKLWSCWILTRYSIVLLSHCDANGPQTSEDFGVEGMPPKMGCALFINHGFI